MCYGQDLYSLQIDSLFQVMLTYLVYEKEQKLKIMMKMHGLKDGPYWLISYAYFFALSVIYMTFFVIFGSLIGNFLPIYFHEGAVLTNKSRYFNRFFFCRSKFLQTQ